MTRRNNKSFDKRTITVTISSKKCPSASNLIHYYNAAVANKIRTPCHLSERYCIWGFTSSPFIVGDIVVVGVAGSIAAYDIDLGELRWFDTSGGKGYSSPHYAMIDGTEQTLYMSEEGTAGFDPPPPINGIKLWMHSWKVERILQPALLGNGDFLICAEAQGMRCIAVSHNSEGWHVEERWTTKRLRPNFNDVVGNDGHVFGFNGNILVCIDIEDGSRFPTKQNGGAYALTFLSHKS